MRLTLKVLLSTAMILSGHWLRRAQIPKAPLERIHVVYETGAMQVHIYVMRYHDEATPAGGSHLVPSRMPGVIRT